MKKVKKKTIQKKRKAVTKTSNSKKKTERKDSEQKGTIRDITVHNWEVLSKDLKGWELELIQKRFEAYSYRAICDLIVGKYRAKSMLTENYLRKCLSKGGRLYDAYEAYSKLQAEEATETAKNTIQAHSSTAANAMVAMLRKKTGEMVRYLASKDILDRSIGKPEDTVNVKNSFVDFMKAMDGEDKE